MLIKLHGIFATDFGPEYRIEAPTIAEAIEGLTRQIGFYDDRPIELRPVCRVMECLDPLKLYEKTELKEINLVPAMIGGGGGIGKIIIGAAIMAAIVFSGGTWTPLAVAIFTMGATLALQGAMQLFMKAPTLQRGNQSTDPEASKYFGLSDNTVQIGTPIAIQYGRGPASGHLLAINVDAQDIVEGNFPTTPT